jgi:hypothetical protein
MGTIIPECSMRQAVCFTIALMVLWFFKVGKMLLIRVMCFAMFATLEEHEGGGKILVEYYDKKKEAYDI